MRATILFALFLLFALPCAASDHKVFVFDGGYDSPALSIAVGDTVTAMVKNIDLKNRKVRLSFKESETASDVHVAKQYINNCETIGSNLGKALADIKILEVKD